MSASLKLISATGNIFPALFILLLYYLYMEEKYFIVIFNAW
jgi:hypothetical protein